MRLFECDQCGQSIHFDNRVCVNCGHRLAFVPERLAIHALAEEEGGVWHPVARPEHRVRLCANEAGEAISTIMQRASNKRYTKEDVSQMVQKLVEVGDLQTLEVSHPKRGITTRYTSFRI